MSLEAHLSQAPTNLDTPSDTGSLTDWNFLIVMVATMREIKVQLVQIVSNF